MEGRIPAPLLEAVATCGCQDTGEYHMFTSKKELTMAGLGNIPFVFAPQTAPASPVSAGSAGTRLFGVLL